MILCSGEALIDMLPRRGASGATLFEPRCGGSVFNTAIALARLDAPAGFFGALSSDLFGALLADRLEANGVDLRFAIRSARPTTLAFVELEHGQASYTFYDENTAGRLLTEQDLPNVPEAVSAFFFGGISLATSPCADAYEAMVHRCDDGRPIMLDFNVRPGLGLDDPEYRARMERIIGRVDIVKVSDEDLALFYDTDDVVDAAHRMVDGGPSLVCLTEGPKGARGVTARGEVAVAAPSITVVDTVGAGDTFNGGVLAALRESGRLTREALREIGDDDVRAAISLGVRAAAVTASREGADPPSRAQLPAEPAETI